jgi:hypothetical protein
LGIKLKQESSITKDLVLAYIKFDIARFVGKENVIYEVNMDSGTFGANVKITLEISITKFTEDAGSAVNGGRTQSIMMNAADIKQQID